MARSGWKKCLVLCVANFNFGWWIGGGGEKAKERKREKKKNDSRRGFQFGGIEAGGEGRSRGLMMEVSNSYSLI